MKKIPLHIQILVGMLLGIVFAMLSIKFRLPTAFTLNYIKPFSTMFINSLNLVAMPLVLVSLTIGVTSVEDVKKLSRIGGKTCILFFITTILSASLGILISNIVKPGQTISEQTRQRLFELYSNGITHYDFQTKQLALAKGPLQVLVDLIPTNIFHALTNNLNLLQIVFFSIFFGVSLLKINSRKRAPVIALLEGINEAILELIKFIMRLAPIGVFSLMASLLVEIVGDDHAVDIFEILYALLSYVSTVIGGLAAILFVLYPIILKLCTNIRCTTFFKSLYPAQLLSFTTSSSSAALPVTMECIEKKLKIPEEISSFVLPLGATINMNGTSLYQGIVCVFVAQVLGIELSLVTQCTIVINVTLSSIGVAGVPGAGMIMTTLVFQSIGIPVAGIALIFAPERFIDMCRTVINITGDALVASIVANSEKK